jgi:exonuclease VII large subunit
METIDLLIENLITLAIQKKNYYQSIFDLTKEQADAIKNDNNTKLEEKINSKQDIIEKVDSQDDKFNLIFNKLKEILNVNDLSKIDGSKYPLLKDLQEEIRNINNIGKNIQELEKSNMNNLKNEMEKVKKEIDSISNSKRVNKVYANPYSKPVSPYFFDTKK